MNQAEQTLVSFLLPEGILGYTYPAEGGFIENNIYTDEAGDRWLLIFVKMLGKLNLMVVLEVEQGGQLLN
ncbi:hypothetical protein HDC90_004944 [Pedobacter sp. AK013]|uniref:hypothetical protein n=1 Tax=Pedobacter sp. AK013 TaxID=2723071 RepID=UPI00160EEE5B|nr:hypothetical protein [Pedobacter sp. AK013]MBB6240275.1 hypothetical protein [Pedobacter sp. AK013]